MAPALPATTFVVMDVSVSMYAPRFERRSREQVDHYQRLQTRLFQFHDAHAYSCSDDYDTRIMWYKHNLGDEVMHIAGLPPMHHYEHDPQYCIVRVAVHSFALIHTLIYSLTTASSQQPHRCLMDACNDHHEGTL